jgi:hypothetical protein
VEHVGGRCSFPGDFRLSIGGEGEIAWIGWSGWED